MDANNPEAGTDQFDYQQMENWVDEQNVGSYEGSGEYTPPPVGQYGLKLARKHPTTPVKPEFNDSGKPKFQAQFEFEIIEADDEQWLGHIIKQYYTISLNEKANLRPVIEALAGRPLLPTDRMGWKDGTQVDAQGNVWNVVGIGGKTMRATITHKTNQRGQTLPKIMGPIPWKAKKTKTAPEPEAATVGGTNMEDVPF